MNIELYRSVTGGSGDVNEDRDRLLKGLSFTSNFKRLEQAVNLLLEYSLFSVASNFRPGELEEYPQEAKLESVRLDFSSYEDAEALYERMSSGAIPQVTPLRYVVLHQDSIYLYLHNEEEHGVEATEYSVAL
jgi:hypothetical protein